MPITYDQPTGRTYKDTISITGGQTMNPGDRDRALGSMQSLASQREQAMRRYFGDAIYDPYFDPTSVQNMVRTPEGRNRLHEMDVASGRKKSATQLANEAWMQNSPLAPAKGMPMPNPATLDPNSYQYKFGNYGGGYGYDPLNPDKVYVKSATTGGKATNVRPGY
jgi:hypothetical protein